MPLSPLVAEAVEATVVPEAVFMTEEEEGTPPAWPPGVAAVDSRSTSLESLESPPGRLARLLVDLHRLLQARLLIVSYKQGWQWSRS